MKKIVLIGCVFLAGCGYSDSHDLVYSPTIVTNSNVPVPNQNWSWNKNKYNGNRDDGYDVPLYYRHRPYYLR